MKKGWEYKRLKDVAKFTRGLTYSKNDEAELSNNIVLRSNNVDLSTGKLNFDELKYLRPEFSIPEDKIVKKGSLLMCMSNGSKIHLGKVALIDEDYPYAFGGFMALVTPNEELNPNFFLYSLSSPDYKGFIKKLSAGANINNIKVKELELFTIPVPPLSEQQSIVDYLDSAFAKIDAMKANAEKALNEAKALFQASLKEMLEPKEGWNSMKLGDFAYMKAGDFVKASDIYQDYAEGLYPCYGGNGFRGYVKEPNQEGDFCLIGRQGALCGCVNRAKGIFRTTEHAVIVKPYQDIPTSLVYYMLINLNLNKYATGAAQPGLSVKNIAEQVIIPVPPQNAQYSIATILDSLKSKVDRLQENYEKISQECDALKQAILRQVFE